MGQLGLELSVLDGERHDEAEEEKKDGGEVESTTSGSDYRRCIDSPNTPMHDPLIAVQRLLQSSCRGWFWTRGALMVYNCRAETRRRRHIRALERTPVNTARTT